MQEEVTDPTYIRGSKTEREKEGQVTFRAKGDGRKEIAGRSGELAFGTWGVCAAPATGPKGPL